MIEFLNSEAGLAVKGLVVVAFLDFATGAFAALRDGTFALDVIAAFIRKHILGRVAPVATLLVVGYYSGETGAVFMAGGIAAAAAYVVETGASILGNVSPPKESDVKDNTAAAALNPVPED
jgi:uncharacterized protein (DUF2164 family)